MKVIIPAIVESKKPYNGFEPEELEQSSFVLSGLKFSLKLYKPYLQQMVKNGAG